jgi:hypothetical protein
LRFLKRGFREKNLRLRQEKKQKDDEICIRGASMLILPKLFMLCKSIRTLEINTELNSGSPGKEPTGRLWRRWENIKMVVKQSTSKKANLIHLAYSVADLVFLWTWERSF